MYYQVPAYIDLARVLLLFHEPKPYRVFCHVCTIKHQYTYQIHVPTKQNFHYFIPENEKKKRRESIHSFSK